MSDFNEWVGDLVYEVWRRGGDPDLVYREDVRDCYEDGHLPEDCVEPYVEHPGPNECE